VLGVAPPLRPDAGVVRRRAPAGWASARGRGLWLPTLAFGGLLCLITFYAKGGLRLETMTATEMALTIAGGIAIAAAALTVRSGTPPYGLWPTLLLLGFALLSALSIVWSVQPDVSWRDADRLLAYTAVFGAAVALARVGPRHWPALLGGITLASVVVCGYALLTKSLPEQFVEANKYARLYEPYGYWNALGLTAATGVICCMWLGSRRAGHALLSALAYPAMGLLLLTLLLAYSRGALAALALALVLWFAIVPLRLRGAAVLLAGAVAAGAIAAWDFGNHALSSEGVAVSESASAGHELGALVLAMLVVLTLVGVAVVFTTARRPPTAVLRRRGGTALLALIGVAILAFAGALAHSHRGFTGSISHAFNTLTDTNAKVANTPERLTAVASVRARYWDEALHVFRAHPALGAGAGGYEVARLRYRTTPLPVKHAHGFIVQTLADLGIVGLVLALVLMLAWMAAAGRGTHPLNRRWRSWREVWRTKRPAWSPLPAGEGTAYGPERIGMLSMVCLVFLFGLHSTIDWTWYVPGNAVVALLCAGWVAGRGPLGATPAPATAGAPATAAAWTKGRLFAGGRPGSVRIAIAAAVMAASLIAAFSQWQPQRAEDARESAESLSAGANGRSAALAAARTAVSRDPLSVEALFVLADIQEGDGQSTLARDTLRRAVRLQPSNPQTWLTLGRYDLAGDPKAALAELRAGIYLDPESIAPEALAPNQPGHVEAIQLYNDYIQALRASAQTQTQTQTTVKTATALPSRATRALRRAARRRRVLRLLESQNPK
jgi:O-antigen ligase